MTMAERKSFGGMAPSLPPDGGEIEPQDRRHISTRITPYCVRRFNEAQQTTGPIGMRAVEYNGQHYNKSTLER